MFLCSGVANAFAVSICILRSMSFGVPAGAERPYRKSDSNLGLGHRRNIRESECVGQVTASARPHGVNAFPNAVRMRAGRQHPGVATARDQLRAVLKLLSFSPQPTFFLNAMLASATTGSHS